MPPTSLVSWHPIAARCTGCSSHTRATDACPKATLARNHHPRPRTCSPAPSRCWRLPRPPCRARAVCATPALPSRSARASRPQSQSQSQRALGSAAADLESDHFMDDADVSRQELPASRLRARFPCATETVLEDGSDDAYAPTVHVPPPVPPQNRAQPQPAVREKLEEPVAADLSSRAAKRSPIQLPHAPSQPASPLYVQNSPMRLSPGPFSPSPLRSSSLTTL